jgi:hypothetical protein
MTRALRGNGVELVRERALAGAVQGALERLYQLDRVADVDAFVRKAKRGEREALLVRDAGDGTLEMALRVPRLQGGGLDTTCQIIEGVSHFVYLADRARTEREATRLEMELQAEVDKYVVLAASMGRLDVGASAALRARLFDAVSFAHAAGSELGERYRVANDFAGKFVRKLEQRFVATGRLHAMREELRRFYRMGQEEKLRFGRAA